MAYDKDELIRILHVHAKRLGRSPTTVDILSLGGPQKKAYYRCFGGKKWGEILEIAGLPPVERALQRKYRHKDIPTREDIICAFKSFIEEHGYMPMTIDYPDLYNIARKMFDSDREVVEACGFDYGMIVVATNEERGRRQHMPIESDICRAVQKSMPGRGYSCEFIRKYMRGEFED